MKFIKLYENFNNMDEIHTLKDILSELEDDGFTCDIPEGHYDKSRLSIIIGLEGDDYLFKYSKIDHVIKHVISYLESLNYFLSNISASAEIFDNGSYDIRSKDYKDLESIKENIACFHLVFKKMGSNDN